MAARAKEPSPPAQLRELAEALPPVPGAALARAYLVRGDERYFREHAIARITEAARAGGLEVVRRDARDPDFAPSALLDDLVAVPMFAAARCIVLRNATSLLKKEEGQESSVARALVAYVQGKGPAGGTLIVDAEGLRADHALVKAVAASGGRVLALRRLWDSPPAWDPDPRKAELVQWLLSEARAKKVPLSAEDALYVCAATGNDLFALAQALDRLKASGANEVRARVAWTNGASPFQLAEDLVRGATRPAVAGTQALFRSGFQEKDGSRGVDPSAILAILLGTLRNKLRQSYAGALALEAGLDLAAATAKAFPGGSPAQRAEFEARVRLRSAAEWRGMIDDLAAVERRTRTARTVDANDIVALALRWRRAERAPVQPARGARRR